MTKIHYKCSKLPTYQITNLVNTTRKFTCELCFQKETQNGMSNCGEHRPKKLESHANNAKIIDIIEGLESQIVKVLCDNKKDKFPEQCVRIENELDAETK